jgi:signal transduction histidine kinase
LNNIGIVYSQQGYYEKAYSSFEKALEIFTDLNQMGQAPRVLNHMAHTSIIMGDYEKAILNLDKGIKISEEVGLQDAKLEAYQRYHELYAKRNEFKVALSYFEKYSQLKDSLFNDKKTQQLAYIEESYEIEKRERENELLRQQQATQDEVIKRQTLQVKVLVGGVVVFLLFAIYYYRINQQKKKTNEILSQQNEEINSKQKELLAANESLQISEQQLHSTNLELQTVNSRLETTVKKRTSELQRTNQELDTFLYQSSHALRRPIVHVKGLVQLARIEPDPHEVMGLYDKLDDTATRMDLMLKKLVMASEIYVTEPEVEQIDFKVMIREVWDSLTDSVKVQSVTLEQSIPERVNFRADRKLLKIMLLNLLENAIFYNEATKRKRALVAINIVSNPKSLDIKVNDNGIGITEESIASIFDLFSVGTDKTRGYGLGLYIVKKAVEKLQGVITVSSKRNKFTTFHITLPKDS